MIFKSVLREYFWGLLLLVNYLKIEHVYKSRLEDYLEKSLDKYLVLSTKQ